MSRRRSAPVRRSTRRPLTSEQLEQAREVIFRDFEDVCANAGFAYSGPDEVFELWKRLARITNTDDAAPKKETIGRLNCGSCGAVLCRLTQTFGLWPEVVPHFGRTGDGKRNVNPKRTNTPTFAGPGRSESTWRVSCPRCRREHTLRAERLLRAFLAAAESDRTWLAVGDGDYSLSKGHRDL